MKYLYLIHASPGSRVQSRVLQVFDRQMAAVTSFLSVMMDGEVYMRVCAEGGNRECLHVEAMLLQLEDVCAVRAFPVDEHEDAGDDTSCPFVLDNLQLRRNWSEAESAEFSVMMRQLWPSAKYAAIQ